LGIRWEESDLYVLYTLGFGVKCSCSMKKSLRIHIENLDIRFPEILLGCCNEIASLNHDIKLGRAELNCLRGLGRLVTVELCKGGIRLLALRMRLFSQ